MKPNQAEKRILEKMGDREWLARELASKFSVSTDSMASILKNMRKKQLVESNEINVTRSTYMGWRAK